MHCNIIKKSLSFLILITFLFSNITYADTDSYQSSNTRPQELRVIMGSSSKDFKESLNELIERGIKEGWLDKEDIAPLSVDEFRTKFTALERALALEYSGKDKFAERDKLAPLFQAAIDGDKAAYQNIKDRPLSDLIANFENRLPEIIKNLPEDLFGFGFGYDIRGNAQQVQGGTVNMTPENLYLIGKLLGSLHAERGDKILVTGDVRRHTAIFRYSLVLGYLSVGVNAYFSEEGLTTGAHNVYSAENSENYKHQVQISGSHGVPEKNGAKIKIDFGDGLLEPLYAKKLEALYKNKQRIRKGVSLGRINEVEGIQDAVIEMYNKTLPKFINDEILIVDTRAGAGGPFVEKLFTKRGFKLIDMDEVNKKNIDISEYVKELWEEENRKIVILLNAQPDVNMSRGIWDPSKPEALLESQHLVNLINGNRSQGMPKAIGGVFDGDADRMTAIREDGEAIPSSEMTLPYYQRFLLDPQNKAAIIKMVKHGGDPIWLACDVRSNNKLSGLLDSINRMYQKEAMLMDKDFITGWMINTGYPPQLDFIRWRIGEMDKFVKGKSGLSEDEEFMENYKNLKRTYFTAEASGHNFFQASPGNPYRPCDDGIAAFSVLVNIRETIGDIEAPALGMKKEERRYELVELFEKFPVAFSSSEIRIPISNDIKIPTAKKIGTWLKEKYGDQLKTNEFKKPIEVGNLLLQPKDDGFIVIAGFKAQLKDGRSALVRWSNTGEQLTLNFTGYDWLSCIEIVREVTERLREEGLDVTNLENEIKQLKIKIKQLKIKQEKYASDLRYPDNEIAKMAVREDRRTMEVMLHNTLAKLRTEDVESQMSRLYGKSFEEAANLDALKMAEVGFETKKDGTKVNRLGWTIENVKWLLDNPGKVEKVLKDAEHIRDKFKYVIFCGMGGSGLGVQIVKTTFGEPEGLEIYSLRTTDPAVIKDILDKISKDAGSLETALSETLIIPISKSGTTKETVSHKEYFETLFAKFQLDIKNHMWVITDKGSPMDTGDYEQREIQLNGKGDIGGRFTAPTTNVFLLPLALAAPERVEKVLRKAIAMNEVHRDTFMTLGAYLYNMAAESGKDKLVFMVPEELRDLPMWSEQLFEESLGKDGKGISVFYGEDIQEASLRGAKENDRVFLRVNVGGKKPNDDLWDYLKKSGYDTFEIDVDSIDSIGGIMLGFERAVAMIGYLWDINFVDQPAVEGYKNATREITDALMPGEKVEIPSDWKSVSFNKLNLYYDRLIKIGAISEEELISGVEKLGAAMDDASAVYAAIINILRPSPGFEAKEFASYGKMTKGMEAILQEARKNIFTDGLKMPSKLGEGPGRDHSYEQSIADGKDMWFSTYFMPLQIEQPETLEYDDNLIKAQAIGTVNTRVNRLRKVVFITFDSTMEEAEQDMADFFTGVQSYLNLEKAKTRAMDSGV